MKTKLFFGLTVLAFSFSVASAQVPQGFNYQAIARDGSGNPIKGTLLQVRFTVQSLSTGGTVFWQELHPSVTTNDFGLFTLVLGTGTRQNIAGSVSGFDLIDWTVTPKYLKTEIYYSGTWRDMGPSQLWSVPYSMVAGTAEKSNGVNAGTKLSVVSNNDATSDALFEVKRKDGQTVFAVYPDAVNIYVPRSGKGVKGGFAVGGFDATKLPPQDYFRVTPDSVRIYIDPTPGAKGTKGGFAVGGYDVTKGINNMYFNLTGASSVNTVAGSPQILWYPNKNAFLAGNVHIGSVDSVGDYSTALGYQSIAMGKYSQAIGYRAKAFGDYSTSIGKNSIAGSKVPAAFNAFAFGDAAKATGADSYAFGSNSSASSPYSVAIGYGAKSMGYYAHSFGLYSEASGHGSLALGMYAKTAGQYSGSMGYYAEAKNDYSVAVGYYAKAQAAYSGAFGRGAITNGISSIAVGYNAQTAATGTDASAFGKNSFASGSSSVAVGYGATTGSGATDASSFGKSANATGASSMALGISASSIGLNSIAIGNTAVANAESSTSIGSNTTTEALARYSTALGYGSSTGGEYATALGYNAQAKGAKSISIGAYYDYTYYRFSYNPLTRKFTLIPVHVTKTNIAENDYSIAIGNGNTSSSGGLSVGSNNTAREIGAVAIGHTNYADSAYSFAAGANNAARGYNAFAMGESVTAEAANSFVIGYNNITDINYNRADWVTTDPLFVIGNGGSGSASNAMLVAKNGNTTINGNLTVTGTISSYAGTGDGLGNHTASQILKMNGYYLNNNGTAGQGIYINSSNNVYVYGTLYSSSTLYTSGRGLFYSTTDATGTAGSGSVEIGGSLRLDGDEIITNTGTTLLINDDNSSNVRVDGGTLFVDAINNRIGVNNTAPTFSLDITGNLHTTSSARFDGDVSTISTTPTYVLEDTDGDNFMINNNAGIFYITGNKTRLLGFTVEGPYYTPVGATNLPVYIDNTGVLGVIKSSLRYKKDINPLENIAWLYSLNPVNFIYKNDASNTRQYGLIAEEVSKVNKDFVSFDKEGNPETVNYNSLVTPLLKAVQEQKITIESLKSDNEALKQRLEKLESIINSLTQIQK